MSSSLLGQTDFTQQVDKIDKGVLVNTNPLPNVAKISRRRKILRVFLSLIGVSLIIGIIAGVYLYREYPDVKKQARAEENVFWAKSNRLSQEDRSALANYIVRTNALPHLLPWWEHDRNMCSAVVVKYISLLTGIKFFHTSAWQFRSLRPCNGCVANNRKLTTVWDVTEDFDKDGKLAPGKKEANIHQVKSLTFDNDKLYVIGLLWNKTTWWESIRTVGADVNSHVALILRGKVIHFFHLGDEHPMRIETLEQLFGRGDMDPVWVAEVHEKSRAVAPDWILTPSEFHFVQTNRELAFEQNVWPWMSLKRFLRFPSEPDFVPASWHGVFQKADTLLEKTLLMSYRNGFDPYPTSFREVKQCVTDLSTCYSPASSSVFCAGSYSPWKMRKTGPLMFLRTEPCSENSKE
jgi:hypothetical protein